MTNPFRSGGDIDRFMEQHVASQAGWQSYIYAGLAEGLPRPIKLMNASELSILNWANGKRVKVMAEMAGGGL
ncbi:hypothetical protein KBX59_08800 [Lentilactobacillus hilgardii]|uniref:Uncharacterized protein n=2 Tax=Lentilactobacillus hilgardii TaxID=1588 RepID=C0XGT6_LENH9|nr:hypothetical protein HMPREF0519_0447 [Lentilactobacillus hilgardii DSM 20176 = ATCC 8290]MCP9333458.1 hypothetical protein [Lentilactobacillus hilgardii]MCP9349985.1 hypothetical protein [Lentilactobacillus hilgardii]MCP9352615.1 hypothetical protein [Lentilactobacillus hilgardii]MCT3398122.1 hypothetical protein [Lentilactobacillus hilgardii]